MIWIIRNKKSRPVSRVLYPESFPKQNLYHLSGRTVAGTIVSSLPLTTFIAENKAGSPACRYRQIVIYLALQPMRGTAPDVATRTGELLPRLFTRSTLRIHRRMVVIFCYLTANFRLPSR